MHALTSSSTRVLACLLTAAVFVVASSGTALATDGTWTATAGGNYSSTSNWQSGTVAGGANATADFNTLNISGEVVVTLDTNPTLGHLVFGDTDTGTAGVWSVLSGSGDTLTLDGTSPSITVNQLGVVEPDGFDDIFLNVDLEGTSGFTKLGAGILTLVGEPTNGTVGITGGINVNEGTLRLDSQAVFTTESADQTKTLADGTTLESAQIVLANVTVASGATANLNLTAGATSYINNVTGAGTGETLNLNLASAGTVYTADGDWSGFANLNATGQDATASVMRLRPNGGSFSSNSLANTHWNLDNTSVYTRTNSYGNDINIGALSGTATATVSGGNAGSAARYHVGALNTSTTYAGTFNGSGGLSLEKVGTGTFTVSGGFVGDDTNNSLNKGEADIGRQGGVVRVSEGTLALTNTATSIPGGYSTFYTTIDVLPGATLDVSGTSSTFSTSFQQQLQGSGTIVGDYNHDEGDIRPADVSTVDNDTDLTNVPVPTAGTITFDDNLSFNGGNIVFDMTLNPAIGNDLIQVNGATSVIGGGTVTPNFLEGTPGVGQTYTVLNSLGGFSDAVSGWTVAWPGRGAKPTLFTNGNLLQFTTTSTSGGASLIWTGASSSDWDVETTQNWTNGGSPDVYFQGDGVTFDDTASNKTVDLGEVVSPGSVTVDSSSAYAIAGTGYISGTGTFTKRGTGTLTMTTTNGFSGAASLEGGTVDIGGAGGALGTGNLTMAGATLLTTTGGGLTNSGISVATSSANTIQADGTAGSSGTLALPAISGDGTLTLTSTVNDKWLQLNDTSSFTGALNIGPDGVTGTSMTVRLVGFTTSMPDATVVLSNGAVLANRSGSSTPVVIAMGSVEGDSTSVLNGFIGGGSCPETVWQLGALGTSTEFSGTIIDGGATSGGVTTPVPSSVTKVGTGTLTLSGANTYTGDTRVEGGTLSITSDYLADTADVYLTSGAFFDLNFTGTDTINALYFDGLSQVVGTWGSLASSATYKSALFTGLGILDVTTYVEPVLLIGDYNEDGIVDAADYTVWRDNVGAATLPNRDAANVGVIGEDDYASWKAHFGETAGSGSLTTVGAVPEPSTVMLAGMALLGSMLTIARRRHS